MKEVRYVFCGWAPKPIGCCTAPLLSATTILSPVWDAQGGRIGRGWGLNVSHTQTGVIVKQFKPSAISRQRETDPGPPPKKHTQIHIRTHTHTPSARRLGRHSGSAFLLPLAVWPEVGDEFRCAGVC